MMENGIGMVKAMKKKNSFIKQLVVYNLNLKKLIGIWCLQSQFEKVIGRISFVVL